MCNYVVRSVEYHFVAGGWCQRDHTCDADVIQAPSPRRAASAYLASRDFPGDGRYKILVSVQTHRSVVVFEFTHPQARRLKLAAGRARKMQKNRNLESENLKSQI